MRSRILISTLAALTTWASLALAYAITEHAHWTRWVIAIVVLEPLALFAAFTAIAVLVPNSGYERWIRSVFRA